ncbi:MAG: hypothetical protein GY832_21630 [Chloroflexi bacterium]|nr:hypothetical protein [Chloroflexota bacterium]
MSPQKILILDYSVDQSETPAIKRWMPADAQVSALFIDTEESFPDDLVQEDFTHVIHTGSALSVMEIAPFTAKATNYIQKIREKGVAQMGICYGHQLVCRALVGTHAVRSSPNGVEVGWCSVTFEDDAMNLLGVGKNETVWQYHFDEVTELPVGSELLSTGSHTQIQTCVNREQRLFGTQFHPEFDREIGNEIFVKDKESLENQGYNVDDMIQHGPSIDTGKIFFGFFLNQI